MKRISHLETPLYQASVEFFSKMSLTREQLLIPSYYAWICTQQHAILTFMNHATDWISLPCLPITGLTGLVCSPLFCYVCMKNSSKIPADFGEQFWHCFITPGCVQFWFSRHSHNTYQMILDTLVFPHFNSFYTHSDFFFRPNTHFLGYHFTSCVGIITFPSSLSIL